MCTIPEFFLHDTTVGVDSRVSMECLGCHTKHSKVVDLRDIWFHMLRLTAAGEHLGMTREYLFGRAHRLCRPAPNWSRVGGARREFAMRRPRETTSPCRLQHPDHRGISARASSRGSGPARRHRDSLALGAATRTSTAVTYEESAQDWPFYFTPPERC